LSIARRVKLFECVIVIWILWVMNKEVFGTNGK
jgi:hypothetical protein